MSSENKNLRKELKSPDKFQIFVANAMAWGRSNQNALIGFAAAVLLALLGSSIWNSMQSGKTIERQAALSAIDVVYEAEEAAAEKLREPLRAELDAIAASPLPNGKGKQSASAVKQKEIVSKMRAIKADHGESLKQYAVFAETYQDYPEGWIAALRTASAQVDRKEFDAAAKLLKRVLEKSRGNNFFQVQAGLSYVAVLEEQKDLKSALSEIDQLTRVVDSKAQASLLLIKGRLQFADGDEDGARKTLGTILEKHAGSMEAEKARTWRAMLPTLQKSTKS